MRTAIGIASILILSAAVPVIGQTREQDVKSCVNDGSAADLRIRACTALIQAGQETGDVLYNRSQAYVDSGRYELALADISAAVTLQPRHAANLEQRMRIHQRLNLFQMADGDLVAILKIDSTDVRVASLKALNRTMLNQAAEAAADCNALIAASPADHGVHETCGMVYLKANDTTRALAAFEKAIVTGSATDPQPLFGRGLARMKLGQTVAAKADFDKAILSPTKVADFYARFGLVR